MSAADPGLLTPLDDVVQALAVTGADEALSPVPPCWAVRNSYLLQLSHGRLTLFVDGRPAGESARRFAAAAAAAGTPPANTAWLGSGSSGSSGAGQQHAALLQQAALGHKVNHRAGAAADASFELCPLPAATLPPPLARFVPSLPAGSACGSRSGGVRWVALVVATRALEAPCPVGGGMKELFVDYGHEPTTIGWQPY